METLTKEQQRIESDFKEPLCKDKQLSDTSTQVSSDEMDFDKK